MHEATKKLVDYVAELELLLGKAKGKRDDWRERAITAEKANDDAATDAVERMRSEVERLTADNDYLNEMIRKLVKGDGDG